MIKLILGLSSSLRWNLQSQHGNMVENRRLNFTGIKFPILIPKVTAALATTPSIYLVNFALFHIGPPPCTVLNDNFLLDNFLVYLTKILRAVTST